MQDTTTKDQDIVKTRRARPLHVAARGAETTSYPNGNANADALREVHMSLVRAEQNLYNLVQASHANGSSQFPTPQFANPAAAHASFGIPANAWQPGSPAAAFAQGYAPAGAMANPTGLAFGTSPSLTAWGTMPSMPTAPQALLAPLRGLASGIAAVLGSLTQSPVFAPAGTTAPTFGTPAYAALARVGSIPALANRIIPCDISDEGKNFVCQLDLPGLQSDQIEILCFDQVVVVNAYREADGDTATLVQSERGSATQQRTITLPAEIQPSAVRATLADGILTIVLPKLVATDGPRRIKVQG